MSAHENLAEHLSTHRLATGGDGIPTDGEWAWLRCSCGFEENVELPDDTLAPAEVAWERHIAEAVLAWLAKNIADDAMVEVARKAIEDELIDWRDEGRFMVCGNGFTVKWEDGSPSTIIRFRTDIGLRIGLRALLTALTERAAS